MERRLQGTTTYQGPANSRVGEMFAVINFVKLDLQSKMHFCVLFFLFCCKFKFVKVMELVMSEFPNKAPADLSFKSVVHLLKNSKHQFDVAMSWH